MSSGVEATGSFRRLLKHFAMLGGGKTAAGLTGLVYLAIAAKALGAQQLGVLVLIHAYALAFAELVSFKSWQAVIRYGADDISRNRPGAFQRLLRVCFAADAAGAILSTALAAGLAFVLAPIAGLPPDTAPLLALYSLVNLFTLKAAATGVLRLYDRFDLLAMQAQVTPLIRLAGAIIAAALGWGLTGFVIVWFIGAAVAGLSLPLLGARELARQGRWRGIATGVRDARHDGLWRFMIFANGASTVKLSGTHIPPLLVGGVLGPAAAGLYKVAFEVANALIKGAQLAEQVIYPELARLISAGRLGRAARLLPRASLTGFAAGTLFTIILWFFGEPVLARVFSEEFGEARMLLIWLAASGALAAAASPFEPTLYAFGKPQMVLGAQAVSAATRILAMLLLLNLIGLTGAGLAAFIARGVTLGVMVAACIALFRGRRHDKPGA